MNNKYRLFFDATKNELCVLPVAEAPDSCDAAVIADIEGSDPDAATKNFVESGAINDVLEALGEDVSETTRQIARGSASTQTGEVVTSDTLMPLIAQKNEMAARKKQALQKLVV